MDPIEREVRTLGERVGIPEDILLSVFNNTNSTLENNASPTSTNSDLSVSLRSSLFEDHSETGSVPGLDISRSSANPAFQQTINSNLTDQLEAARHEKKLLEVDYDRVLQRAKSQLMETTRKYQAEIDRLQQQMSSLTKQVPDLQKKLDMAREDFEDLNCPGTVYDRLSKIDKDALTIRELVLVKVFEMTASQRAEIESLANELNDAKTYASECERRRKDAEHLLERSEAQSREKLLSLEREMEELKAHAETHKLKYLNGLREIDSLHEKAQLYGSLRNRCDELERDRTAALQQSDYTQANLQTLERELALKSDELQTALQQVELLKVDKSYLKREVDDGKREVLRLEHALDRERQTVSNLQTRGDSDREKLHEARDRSKTEYEERLQREIESLREENKAQIAHLKETQLATSEKEIRSLRAAREEALAEIEHYRNLQHEQQQALEDAKAELSAQHATHQTTLAEVRSQVSIRIFETETLTTTIEEKMSALRKLELENEMLSTKLDVLKSDFTRLETSTTKEIVELNAKVISQEEKLNVYEQLEVELDTALLDKARVDRDHNLENQDENDILKALSIPQEPLLPIAAQRRVKHSVLLAQKLVKTERELEAAKVDSKEKDATILLLKKKLSVAERDASVSSQPTSFFIGKIRSMEQDLGKANKQIESLIQENTVMERRLKQAIETRDKLHQDLQNVLKDRKAIEEAVLQQMEKVKEDEQIRFDAATSPVFSPGFGAVTVSQEAFTSDEGDEIEHIVEEVVDSNKLDTSVESTTFILHKEDNDGVPLPKWYRKLRQPDHDGVSGAKK